MHTELTKLLRQTGDEVISSSAIDRQVYICTKLGRIFIVSLTTNEIYEIEPNFL